MSNINDFYFDGHYKDLWRTIIPDELTVKEVDFIIPYFNLQPGHKVLDLMCGYGRHAIALAKKGIEVTAVDNLEVYISEIKEVITKENLPVKTVTTDVINYHPEEKFELAICMGNSFNFFEEADALKLLSTIASSLQTGGHLLINSWSIAEIAYNNYTSRSWSQIDDIKFLNELKFLLHPTRMETESIMINADGKSEIKNGIDYIYSLNEMEKMMNQAGLLLKEVYSIPGRKKFTLGEPRAYLVAQKK